MLMTDRTYICSSLGQTDETNLELLTAAIISIWSSCLVRRRTISRGRERGAGAQELLTQTVRSAEKAAASMLSGTEQATCFCLHSVDGIRFPQKLYIHDHPGDGIVSAQHRL